MLSALLLVTAFSARADSTLLRILTTNDFHGALEPRVFGWTSGRMVGGVAALKATLDSAAARCRCAVLHLDGGDELQGSLASNLVYGKSTIEAFNHLGLDVAVIGNHELDWGIDTLKARMRESRWRWVGANVFDSATGRRPDWAVPYVIVERGGFRIAVIGYMAERTKQMVDARRVAGLVWKRGPEAIRDALDAARAERPDLTILLAHEGGFCDSLPCRGEVFQLARQLDSTQVQLIVAGHTHTLNNAVVNGIPIVQARSNGTAYGVVDLIRQGDGRRIWRVRVETVYVDEVTPDTGVARVVAAYRPMVERLASRRVATLGEPLTREGNQYPLGSLIADAQRAAAPGLDAALMNNGGIRRDLPAGELNYGDLFELQPFGNIIVRVTLTGAQLKEVMERVVASGRPGFHASGIRVRYDSRMPIGQRVLEIRKVNGTLIRPGGRYQLGVTDFLQGGGDGLALLRTAPAVSTGKTDLQTVVDYLSRMRSPVRGPTDRRFIDIAP